MSEPLCRYDFWEFKVIVRVYQGNNINFSSRQVQDRN